MLGTQSQCGMVVVVGRHPSRMCVEGGDANPVEFGEGRHPMQWGWGCWGRGDAHPTENSRSL